jgi:cytidylate kinase
MTLWMLEHGVDVDDPVAVADAAEKPLITAGTDAKAPLIALDGVDVSGLIRGAAVTHAVSPVSAVPAVRSRLVDLQRALIGKGGIVVEGRDIGTVVAPDAAVKIYLDASADARAERRGAQLAGLERAAPRPTSEPVVGDHEAVRDALARRDRIDSTRVTAPLAAAEDAHHLDATHLTLAEVIAAVVDFVAATADAPTAAEPR